MNMEEIYISSDSPKSPQSIAVNVSTPPSFQSPPSKFNSLFNGSIKRCSLCLTSIVHFLIICQICNKYCCCRCTHDVKKCCNIYLLSKLNKIIRTPHYPFFLGHVCTLNQNHPPVSKYYDEYLDNFIKHERLVKAKFILNMLTVDNLCSGDMVFILLMGLIKNIKKLDNVFVYILFKNYVSTSILTSNLSQMDGKNLPELPASRNIDDRFRMSYNCAKLTQAHIRKNKMIKTVASHGLVIIAMMQ